MVLTCTVIHRQARSTVYRRVAPDGNGLIKKSDPQRCLAACTKIESRKLAARIVDHPPTVIICRRLVTIKLYEPHLSVAQFVCPKAAWNNLKLFFDLRTVNGMPETYMQSVTDKERVDDPLLFHIQGETDPLSSSRTPQSEYQQQPQSHRYCFNFIVFDPFVVGFSNHEQIWWAMRLHLVSGTLMPFSL
jgi:hypothetical protein